MSRLPIKPVFVEAPQFMASLRDEIDAKFKSRNGFCKTAGISPGNLTRLFNGNGKSMPSLKVILKIARALKKNETALIESFFQNLRIACRWDESSNIGFAGVKDESHQYVLAPGMDFQHDWEFQNPLDHEMPAGRYALECIEPNILASMPEIQKEPLFLLGELRPDKRKLVIDEVIPKGETCRFSMKYRVPIHSGGVCCQWQLMDQTTGYPVSQTELQVSLMAHVSTLSDTVVVSSWDTQAIKALGDDDFVIYRPPKISGRSSLTSRLHARIEQRLVQVGLQMADLMRLMGVDSVTMNRLIALPSKAEPTIGVKSQTWLKLAMVLKVHPYDLIEEALVDYANHCENDWSYQLPNSVRVGFVSDVDVFDRAVVHPGETFIKRWRVQNLGHFGIKAKNHLMLVNISGQINVTCAAGVAAHKPDLMTLQTATQTLRFEQEIFEPKDVIDLQIQMTAPMKTGVAYSVWQVQDIHGEPAFEDPNALLWVCLHVHGSPISSESPQSLSPA